MPVKLLFRFQRFDTLWPFGSLITPRYFFSVPSVVRKESNLTKKNTFLIVLVELYLLGNASC